MKYYAFLIIAAAAGALIGIQSVLNAGLGRRVGSLGSVLILSIVSGALILAIMPIFPGTAILRSIPGIKEWYLYLGGIFGVGILAASILLVPRIGVTAMLTGGIVGQLITALVIDHIGWLGTPKVEVSLVRVLGALLLVAGAYLITRQ